MGVGEVTSTGALVIMDVPLLIIVLVIPRVDWKGEIGWIDVVTRRMRSKVLTYEIPSMYKPALDGVVEGIGEVGIIDEEPKVVVGPAVD